MSNKLNKTYYLISYLQYAFLNDVEAEAAYFSRFRFHQNMTASAFTSLIRTMLSDNDIR